jgi:hypothetical protein
MPEPVRRKNRPRHDDVRTYLNIGLYAPALANLRAVAAAREVRPAHLAEDIVSAWIAENVQ